MKRLHTLNLLVVSDGCGCITLYDSAVVPEFISDVAGAVPSLRNFDFVDYIYNASKLIDLFGEKYPCKKLLVDKLRYMQFNYADYAISFF